MYIKYLSIKTLILSTAVLFLLFLTIWQITYIIDRRCENMYESCYVYMTTRNYSDNLTFNLKKEDNNTSCV